MFLTRSKRQGVVFALMLALTVYVLVSVAIGVATADACGPYASDKTWNLVPPGWECG